MKIQYFNLNGDNKAVASASVINSFKNIDEVFAHPAEAHQFMLVEFPNKKLTSYAMSENGWSCVDFGRNAHGLSFQEC